MSSSEGASITIYYFTRRIGTPEEKNLGGKSKMNGIPIAEPTPLFPEGFV